MFQERFYFNKEFIVTIDGLDSSKKEVILYQIADTEWIRLEDEQSWEIPLNGIL